MREFLAMGGYGWFVWSAYAVTALVLLALALLSVRQARRRALELERLRAQPAAPDPVPAAARPRVARRSGEGDRTAG